MAYLNLRWLKSPFKKLKYIIKIGILHILKAFRCSLNKQKIDWAVKIYYIYDSMAQNYTWDKISFGVEEAFLKVQLYTNKNLKKSYDKSYK